MTPTTPAFTVYAPGAAVWSHPRLHGLAVWLRVHGYLGRLPRWAIRECRAVWPERRCACGAYALIWEKEEDDGSEKE